MSDRLTMVKAVQYAMLSIPKGMDIQIRTFNHLGYETISIAFIGKYRHTIRLESPFNHPLTSYCHLINNAIRTASEDKQKLSDSKDAPKGA